MNKSIKINTDPVANQYTNPNERIIEFSSPSGGGLISFREQGDGLVVDVYRTDLNVTVLSGKVLRASEVESHE